MEENIREKYKTITEFKKSLERKIVSNEEIKGNKLYELLRKHKVFYYDDTKHNVPYQQHVDAGYFQLTRSKGYDEKKKEHWDYALALITPEGESWLENNLIRFGYISLK